MPTVGSARRVLSFTMGICAIFDVTGARVYQFARGSLPEPPPPGSRPDPFLAAMETIMAARREVAPLSDRTVAPLSGPTANAQRIGVTLPA
jgi:hypothetical protein